MTTCPKCQSDATMVYAALSDADLTICKECLHSFADCVGGDTAELIQPERSWHFASTDDLVSIQILFEEHGKEMPWSPQPDEALLQCMIQECVADKGEDVSDPTRYAKISAPGVDVIFRRKNLESMQDILLRSLYGLRPEFRPGAGGGLSIREIAKREDGTIWTKQEALGRILFAMAMAFGWGRVLTPEDEWYAMPGGEPYVALDFPGLDYPLQIHSTLR